MVGARLVGRKRKKEMIEECKSVTKNEIKEKKDEKRKHVKNMRRSQTIRNMMCQYVFFFGV